MAKPFPKSFCHKPSEHATTIDAIASGTSRWSAGNSNAEKVQPELEAIVASGEPMEGLSAALPIAVAVLIAASSTLSSIIRSAPSPFCAAPGELPSATQPRISLPSAQKCFSGAVPRLPLI